MRHPVALSLVALALASTGCARVLRLPKSDVAPIVDAFEFGTNDRVKVFDFEVPEVKKDTQRINSVTLKFGATKLGGAEKQEQVSQRTVLRSGRPLFDAACQARQEGVTVKSRDFSRHTFLCSGPSFALDLQEVREDVYVGTVHLGPVALDIESTDDLEKGIPQYPTGFHLREHGRWLGTFEYFQGGKAYLRPDLAPPVRDAVLSTMVILQSTNRWFEKNLARNQSRAFGM